MVRVFQDEERKNVADVKGAIIESSAQMFPINTNEKGGVGTAICIEIQQENTTCKHNMRKSSVENIVSLA